MFELIYTATPKGLLQGRSGFSTVAMTQGFPPNLIPSVENMSGFRNLYMPGDPNAAKNPVNCSYQQLRFGSSVLLVVSRIEYAGLSYTGRSNTLAHHYVFNASESLWAKSSPASLLSCAENFPPWQGEPRLLPEKNTLPSAPPSAGYAAWERLTGSADWGKIITEMVKRKMPPSIVLQFSPLRHSCDDLLALIGEVSARLSPQQRVDFTFSTYCYQSAIGTPLFLRAYPEGSSLLASIQYLNQDQVLVLGENNAIPEKYRELLCAVIPEIPEKPITPVAVPPVIRQAAPEKPKVVAKPPRPTMTGASAPVAVSRRNWWIVGIAVALLLTLAGSFAFICFHGERNVPPPPTPVETPKPTAPVAPKTDVPAAPKPPVAPVVPKPAVKVVKEKKPVVVSEEEWLNFYLSLHDGKGAIELPDALKAGSLTRVTLKSQYATRDKVTDVFDARNNVVTIHAVTADMSNPAAPRNIPDENKVELTLKIADGILIVEPATKIDEIKTLEFVADDTRLSFDNEFKESYWKILMPRIKIEKVWKPDALLLRAIGTPFVEKKIEEALQWQVTMDDKSANYPIVPGRITMRQRNALNDFLTARKEFKKAEAALKQEPALPKPELLSPDMMKILNRHLTPEELDEVREQVKKMPFDAFLQQGEDTPLGKLQTKCCTYIYSHKKKDWEKDRKDVIKKFNEFRAQCSEFMKQQNKIDRLKKEKESRERGLQDAKKRLCMYPWCAKLLKRHSDADDEALRQAFYGIYEQNTQIKLVRKNQK